MNIGFTKMHGLGNDFIVIDNMNGKISLSKPQVIFLCDRHKGIGADGVILVEKSDKVDSIGSPQADCFMNYINADGSKAQMCGNGVRCVAKFLRDYVLKNKNSFLIDTRAGIKQIEHTKGNIFSVNMGKASFFHNDFPKNPLRLGGLQLNFVSVGNPHAVAFVGDLNKYDLLTIGPQIEHDKHFPNKINFELVKIISKAKLLVKVWERGCGATLACGTGACAVYVIARKYKKIKKEAIIQLPGGNLFMSENSDGDIIMRGEATSVFSARLSI